jgi:4-diphosphocytidyl-2C-methyl-D-erythritol kinase
MAAEDMETITVRIPAQLKCDVEQRAEKSGQSFTTAVRNALFAWLSGSGALCACIHSTKQHDSKGHCLIETCTCKRLVEIGWRA